MPLPRLARPPPSAYNPAPEYRHCPHAEVDNMINDRLNEPGSELSPEERRKFAADRSHADAKAVNEHARTAALYVMIINGGAATATLAVASNYYNTGHLQGI